jgi:DNA invertase Pin-like site-specific DNA recombinase
MAASGVWDAKGQLRHEGGVVEESPGLYALGLPMLRRRNSTFIYGIEDDAREVIEQLAVNLAAAAGDADPRTGLRAVAALRKLADQLERAQVRSARAQGWSWAEIAKELGVTRQAAFKKHHGG